MPITHCRERTRIHARILRSALMLTDKAFIYGLVFIILELLNNYIILAGNYCQLTLTSILIYLHHHNISITLEMLPTWQSQQLLICTAAWDILLNFWMATTCPESGSSKVCETTNHPEALHPLSAEFQTSR